MPEQIIWSPLAESDILSIPDCLHRNWEMNVALAFIDITFNPISQI